jgi:hypothetical protein
MTKTETVPSAAKGFRLIGKLYRWTGWFGILVTLGIALYGFAAEWQRIANYTGSYPPYSDPLQRLLAPFLLAVGIMACGLTLCAVSFLVSAIIDTCVNLTENNRARVDLLRRLVREQSDVQ